MKTKQNSKKILQSQKKSYNKKTNIFIHTCLSGRVLVTWTDFL